MDNKLACAEKRMSGPHSVGGRPSAPNAFDAFINGVPLPQTDPADNLPRADPFGRRARIFAAVRSELAKSGSAKFTLREVAAHSHTTVQSIHNLVGTKRDALVGAVLDHGDAITVTLSQSHHNTVRVFDLIDLLLICVARYPSYFREAGLAGTSPEIRSAFHKAGGLFFRDALAEDRGFFRDDIELTNVANTLSWTLLNTFYDWARGDATYVDLAELISERTSLIMLGASSATSRPELERCLASASLRWVRVQA